ncbi:MAG: uracil-DNA glycosylase [Pseudomonadota bacterium]|uniref:uracil-DNA glycosylase n=1 Tax=Polaromonas sp. TaxID=1869339 RepID=UPI0018368800|nr:uracil-DNA glycosylase [Polaromonas sp.]MBA3594615.1 uracil-DNA glycosylase [Polaromonas sp.]MDQ3272530.1 uracil-DNA glycosylase [Pseudomonadota bacterium]
MSQGLQANLAFENLSKPPPEGTGHGRHLARWAPAEWPLAADWAPVVGQFLASQVGQRLGAFIEQRLAAGAIIYPPQPFRALALTPLADVRVVILGQDPYHGPGQAQGLAFSVPDGVRPPPSLRNIFKELVRDPAVTSEPHSSGSLERWARQGVLLLNTSLTVEEGQAASHARQGWETLTDQLISAVSARPEPVVFMLWGAHAQAKQALIAAHHLVLRANHPSPLSALRPPVPFLGCGHFSAANRFLQGQGAGPIHW